MGILNWFTKKKTEKFSSDYTFEQAIVGGAYNLSAAGVQITQSNAKNFDTVYACVRSISEDVASLPLPVYQRLPNGGKTRVENHPVWRCFNVSPDGVLDAFQFREYINGSLLQWGNAYCEIEPLFDGELNLHPLPPNCVEPKRNPDGSVYYRVQGGGSSVDIPSQEMLHFAMFGDGLKGYSPVLLGKDAIGLGKAMEQFGSTFFKNGCQTSGVITHPGTLSPQAQQALADGITQRHNSEHAHRLLVLAEGMTYEQISVSPEAAQFLASRVYQTQEICRLFRIDPSIIGEHSNSTWNNVEQQSLNYVAHCLRPHCRRLESEINRKLFPNQYEFFMEHVLDEMTRGDKATMNADFTAGRMGGWYTVNEIREQKGMNPAPGGDILLQPLNMVPAGLDDDQDAATDDDEEGVGQSPKKGTIPVVIDDTLSPNLSPVNSSLEAVQDAVDRMVRREIEAVRQAAKTPKAFLTTIDGFYSKHSDICERAIRPSVNVWSAITQKSPPNLTESIVNTGRGELLALSGEVTNDDLANAVEKWAEKRINISKTIIRELSA